MTTVANLDALTLRIGRAWGVGLRDKDNGVVIGISQCLRQMRIQNGYGIENVLSDAETQNIIDTAFIPQFRQSKYFEGVFNGLITIMTTLEKRYE